MATLKIQQDLMPFLCKKAEEEGKSITDILDDLLRSAIEISVSTNGVLYRCKNCKSPIDYEINQNTGYCDYCECVVFIDEK